MYFFTARFIVINDRKDSAIKNPNNFPVVTTFGVWKSKCYIAALKTIILLAFCFRYSFRSDLLVDGTDTRTSLAKTGWDQTPYNQILNCVIIYFVVHLWPFHTIFRHERSKSTAKFPILNFQYMSVHFAKTQTCIKT